MRIEYIGMYKRYTNSIKSISHPYMDVDVYNILFVVYIYVGITISVILGILIGIIIASECILNGF